MVITANRYHDFSAGHRVFGHESKCAHLHGHNYRVHFHLASKSGLDDIGRVLDFGVIKEKLCIWLEEFWDHKFLIWVDDPWRKNLYLLDPKGVVICPFNPTAENMAQYLIDISHSLLQGTGCELLQCTIEETRKCSVTIKT